MKLLNIICSPRGEKSRTNEIAKVFLKTVEEKYPDIVIENLDLTSANLPIVLGDAVDAKYSFMAGVSPDEKSLRAWNEISRYSTEFVQADIYLISTPMWNFSIPYRLKQYIDIIMQAGTMFKFTESGVQGLAENKKMFVISSRGSDYGQGTPMNQFDFLEPYLRSIFGFGGITDISFLHAQPLDYSPDLAASVMEKARKDAELLALTI